MFFPNLADSWRQKFPRPKNKFEIKTIGDYNKQVRHKCEDVDITSVEKILKDFYVAKVSGIDRTSAKFPKNIAPVITIHLVNIISLSIKLDTIPLQCKIAKIKPLFKKGIKTEAKNCRPISLPPLISLLPLHCGLFPRVIPVSSSGMFVKRESTSSEAINNVK